MYKCKKYLLTMELKKNLKLCIMKGLFCFFLFSFFCFVLLLLLFLFVCLFVSYSLTSNRAGRELFMIVNSREMCLQPWVKTI